MAYNPNNVNIVDYLGFKNQGGDGLVGQPIYDKRVLAEGDSWFHIGGNTPAFKERNILDAVDFKHQHTLLLNMAMSGDTMGNMSERMNNPFFYKLLKTYQWDFILLSAGGNDLIDALTERGNYKFNNKILSIIQNNPKGTSYKDFINFDDLDLFKESILYNFDKFRIAKDKTRNQATPIVLHTYDFPTPRNAPAKFFGFERGPWLYDAFRYKRVLDTTFWVDMTDEIFNVLANALISLDGKNNFNVTKTIKTLDRALLGKKGNDHDWLNEIHPNPNGIKKIAARINKKIESLI